MQVDEDLIQDLKPYKTIKLITASSTNNTLSNSSVFFVCAGATIELRKLEDQQIKLELSLKSQSDKLFLFQNDESSILVELETEQTCIIRFIQVLEEELQLIKEITLAFEHQAQKVTQITEGRLVFYSPNLKHFSIYNINGEILARRTTLESPNFEFAFKHQNQLDNSEVTLYCWEGNTFQLEIFDEQGSQKHTFQLGNHILDCFYSDNIAYFASLENQNFVNFYMVFFQNGQFIILNKFSAMDEELTDQTHIFLRFCEERNGFSSVLMVCQTDPHKIIYYFYVDDLKTIRSTGIYRIPLKLQVFEWQNIFISRLFDPDEESLFLLAKGKQNLMIFMFSLVEKREEDVLFGVTPESANLNKTQPAFLAKQQQIKQVHLLSESVSKQALAQVQEIQPSQQQKSLEEQSDKPVPTEQLREIQIQEYPFSTDLSSSPVQEGQEFKQYEFQIENQVEEENDSAEEEDGNTKIEQIFQDCFGQFESQIQEQMTNMQDLFKQRVYQLCQRQLNTESTSKRMSLEEVGNQLNKYLTPIIEEISQKSFSLISQIFQNSLVLYESRQKIRAKYYSGLLGNQKKLLDYFRDKFVNYYQITHAKLFQLIKFQEEQQEKIEKLKSLIVVYQKNIKIHQKMIQKLKQN